MYLVVFVAGKRWGVRCDGFDEFDRSILWMHGWLEHVLLKCLFIHSKGFFSSSSFDYLTYIHRCLHFLSSRVVSPTTPPRLCGSGFYSWSFLLHTPPPTPPRL